MKVGYLPSRVHLECDTHAADAEQPHALVHVVIPSRTDRISQSLDGWAVGCRILKVDEAAVDVQS